jgi:hypothetical protein
LIAFLAYAGLVKVESENYWSVKTKNCVGKRNNFSV